MSASTDETGQPTFEHALEHLASIVHDLEDGQIGLTESLVKYEQGVRLLKQCYELLQKAERRIELLTRLEATGEAITEPFDDAPSTNTSIDIEASAKRSRRRSTNASGKGQTDPQIDNSGDDPSAMDVPGGLF